MNWGQQALEAWLEESARHDDDAITLAKYARSDESKIKVISLRELYVNGSVRGVILNTPFAVCVVCTLRYNRYPILSIVAGSYSEIGATYGGRD